MATDRTGEANYAWAIAGYFDLIRDGKPTRDSRIVATLMHSNKEVTYEKVKQISTAIDGEDLQASHLSSSQYRSQVPLRTGSNPRDNCNRQPPDFQDPIKVRDLFCETSFYKQWHIADPQSP